MGKTYHNKSGVKKKKHSEKIKQSVEDKPKNKKVKIYDETELDMC